MFYTFAMQCGQCSLDRNKYKQYGSKTEQRKIDTRLLQTFSCFKPVNKNNSTENESNKQMHKNVGKVYILFVNDPRYIL